MLEIICFLYICYFLFCLFFFFNDTATTEIYTLSLHDALPIYHCCTPFTMLPRRHFSLSNAAAIDRKSTRLNSSHVKISYAVFCLKKKKITTTSNLTTERLIQRTPPTRRNHHEHDQG